MARYLNGERLTHERLAEYDLLAGKTTESADKHTQQLAGAVISLTSALGSVLEEDEKEGTK